jgi:hypothetical protein
MILFDQILVPTDRFGQQYLLFPDGSLKLRGVTLQPLQFSPNAATALSNGLVLGDCRRIVWPYSSEMNRSGR